MYCKDCKFWSKNGLPEGEQDDYRCYNDSPESLGLGRCTRVELLWDAYEWDREDRDNSVRFTEEVVSEEVLAFVNDGSDYKAELYTLPNFGCVMFKEYNTSKP